MAALQEVQETAQEMAQELEMKQDFLEVEEWV